MKVTLENKKGLNKDLKVFIDKNTMNTYMDKKYEEIKNTVNLKGFRPGKVPKEVLKRQFGQAIFGEVLDKILKDSSTKALEQNKIKPAGQPKFDLKTYGEDKDLEYIISVTELPKVEVKTLDTIKYDQYSVKIEASETDSRINEIAKNQNKLGPKEKGKSESQNYLPELFVQRIRLCQNKTKTQDMHNIDMRSTNTTNMDIKCGSKSPSNPFVKPPIGIGIMANWHAVDE